MSIKGNPAGSVVRDRAPRSDQPQVSRSGRETTALTSFHRLQRVGSKLWVEARPVVQQSSSPWGFEYPVSVALRPFEALTIEWAVMITADVRTASPERRSSV